MRNELYYGDNLDVLRRKIAGGSVNLCYIDPPFNSKRNYFQVAELFAPHNRRLDLPMARADAVKSAAAKGDADKQEKLL